jgi:hypothetical protein
VVSAPWWQNMTLSGFARIGVFYTFPFQDQQLVGSNGGFRVADFRLGLEFKPIEKFTVYTGSTSTPIRCKGNTAAELPTCPYATAD